MARAMPGFLDRARQAHFRGVDCFAGPTLDRTGPASFVEWLAGVRTEAIARGVREEIVDAALADVSEPQPVILGAIGRRRKRCSPRKHIGAA